MDHIKRYLRIRPVRITPLKFQSTDLNMEGAKAFKDSILPSLPDYSKKENRKITWISDIHGI